MRIYILILSLAIFASCTPSKITPITGNYPKRPFVITTSSSFITVWDKLIDLFAQNGLPIKIIDRSSGLIISDRSVLSATFELKTGGLKDSSAFLVLPKLYDPISKKTSTIAMGMPVTGEWNVRIKENEGQTTINVNIVNVRYETYDVASRLNREKIATSYQSTGKFEELIAAYIK